MSGLVSPSLEELDAQAAKKARDYDWTAAAELYTRALSNINLDQDDEKRPWMQERAGNAYHQAAMQARNPGELASRIRSAIEHYQSATDGYAKTSRHKARAMRCSAMVLYLQTWLIPTGPEKRKPLEEAWSLTEKSLNAFEYKNDPEEFVRTYNQLAIVQLHSASLVWEYQEFQKKNEDGLALGQRPSNSSPHTATQWRRIREASAKPTPFRRFRWSHRAWQVRSEPCPVGPRGGLFCRSPHRRRFQASPSAYAQAAAGQHCP